MLWRKITGIIILAISLISAAFLYIISFWLWYDLLGFIGILLSIFFVPDIVLLVIRVIRYGFSDWYFIAFICATVLYWIGAMLNASADD